MMVRVMELEQQLQKKIESNDKDDESDSDEKIVHSIVDFFFTKEPETVAVRK